MDNKRFYNAIRIATLLEKSKLSRSLHILLYFLLCLAGSFLYRCNRIFPSVFRYTSPTYEVPVERSEGLPADLDGYFKFMITFPQSIALTIYSRQADSLIKRVKKTKHFFHAQLS